MQNLYLAYLGLSLESFSLSYNCGQYRGGAIYLPFTFFPPRLERKYLNHVI